MTSQRPPRGLLPSTKHKPRTKMSEYSHGIFGAPGIGKSTFANKWRNPLFLATEPGTAAMEAADVEVKTWSDFEACLNALETEDHPWETVVIDTVDLLYAICRQSVNLELGISHPSQAAYALGWDLLKDRWRNGIHRAARLRKKDGTRLCTLFVCHEKVTPLTESREGKAIDTGRSLVTTNLSTSAREVLHSALDFLYHVEFDGDGRRVIRTQPCELPHARIEAKGRGSIDRKLPDIIPLDFRALAIAFNQTFNNEGE